MMSSFATYLFGGEYQQTVAIGILILVLVIKPEGLFGSKQVRPV
jgi:branched-chain amino acid transport system permease protein